MIPVEFKYSDQAHNVHSSAFQKKQIDLINQNIIITSDGNSFKISFSKTLKNINCV